MSKFKYFAYGSNMSIKRLRARTPSAIVVGVATLPEHRLTFHKISKKDGSGKCDIVKEGSEDVLGVLFEIDKSEEHHLDDCEGLNKGYDEKTVVVKLESGAMERAKTYYATNIDPRLKPFTWYKRHVIEGAMEANLPNQYLQKIESIPATQDSDKEREAMELAIYI